jgi:ApaG protein
MTEQKNIENKIHVSAEAKFDTERSKVEAAVFVFSYRVDITNLSDEVIQIKSRTWIITDAFFNIEYMEGEGVVGEYPIIRPGETFSYTSYCPLKTSFGTMKGTYTAIDESGTSLKIEIPEFILAHPFAIQ